MVRGMLSVVLVVLLCVSLGAEDVSPLDRPIADDFRIVNPSTLQPCAAGTVIDQIARKAHVLVGFENAPGCHPSPRATTRQERHRAPGDGEEVLNGITARQAFDHVTAVMPTLTWQDMDGVAVIRPKDAWADGTNPLNVSAAPLGVVSSQKLGDIVDMLLRGTRPSMFVPHRDLPRSATSIDAPVSVTFSGGTLLEALNTLVRSRQGAEWQFAYTGRGMGVLIVSTLDLSGGDVIAPVALPRTGQ